MTGQKNRFSTTEKLWDLDDKQLKTPVHDAMVLWLIDKNNLKKLLNPYICSEECYQIIERDRELDKEDVSYFKCESEVPIMSSPTFIAGYADLTVAYKSYIPISKEVCPIEEEWYDKIRSIKSFEDMEKLIQEYLNDDSFKAKKYALLQKGDNYYHIPDEDKVKDFWLNTVGSDYNIDCASWIIHQNKYKMRVSGIRCLIEVKPYIDSFGAVLRQIKSYKKFYDPQEFRVNEYWYDTLFCLFTLDTRFDAQFESQGITVLHPPENVSKEDMMLMYGLK